MAEPDQSALGYLRALLLGAAVFGALLILGLLVWQLAHVLLVLFAGLLLAVFLDALAFFVQRYMRLQHLPALLLVVTLLLVAIAAFVWLAGPQLSEQIELLSERVPQAVNELESDFQQMPWAAQLIETMPSVDQLLPRPAAIVETIPSVFTTALGAVLNTTIILIIGFYLALEPDIYRRSVLMLLPLDRKPQGERVLEALGHALRWWLVGRLASMVAVGILSGIGLWLIGMPLVLALALLAGALSFIPFLGPILSAIPALLIALVSGPVMALWVLAVYVGVQFLEGNLITPIIQKRAVSLPPVALLSAQMLMGVLVGFIGVLLATPLAVMLIVIVQIVYVRDVLGHGIRVLGEHPSSSLRK